MKIHRAEFYILKHKRLPGYLHAEGWSSFVLHERDRAVIIPGRVLCDIAYDWRMNFIAIKVTE